MGRLCSANGTDEIHTKFWSANVQGTDTWKT
jgi:hypothetical protein